MREARLYNKSDNDAVECFACSWRCKIAPGKTGVCGVRQNVDGKLFLLVFGRAVSANVDPMEKKPLYHFLPGENIFSIGTIGCNFGCEFCQNFDISQASRSGSGKEATENAAGWGDQLEPDEIVAYCLEHRIPAIAFTYNEPAIFSEYAAEVMKLAKPHGIRGVFVSNGYETKEALDFLEPYIDAYNIDLKGFTERYYQKVCKARLSPVLSTIEELHDRKKWLEITTLLVPGENDSPDELKAIAKFISSISPDIPWHISAFFPTYLMTDKISTPPEKMIRAYKIGHDAGLNYVYLGNLLENKYGSTFCPDCGELLIEREGFTVTKYNLEAGKCSKCGQKIAGVWK